MAIIYGAPISPYVRKVMLAHAYKEVPFELKITPPSSEDPEFRDASPFGKIPAYKTDDGFKFADSSVITAYLEKTNTNNPLYPENPNSYAKALWLETFASEKLVNCPALLFQLKFKKMLTGEDTDQARVTELREKLIPEVLDFFEAQLIEDQWLVDNKISIADLSACTFLICLEPAGFDYSKWQKTTKYIQKLNELEIVKNHIATENEFLTQMKNK